MNSTIENRDKTLATLIHLSVFSQFIIPFGNFIFPVILWSTRRKNSFIDYHGKSALNFQISIFLYSIILACAAISTFIILAATNSETILIDEDNFGIQEFSEVIPFMITAVITGIIFLGLFILEIFTVISASLKAGEGEFYEYPFTINFLGLKKPETASPNETEAIPPQEKEEV
ncbi:MAG TPA: DUF4870 domain-containing protein [Salinimicrobium sp.]|nr:DUF4870 domain-containing protein [Salinimicrobium sp.]